MGYDIHSNLWKPVIIHFFQLLVPMTAIMNIVQVVFVVYEHVECQNMKMDNLEKFGMGCDIHNNQWKPDTYLLFPATSS